MQFVDDGSNVAPSYQIAVQSSGLQTNSLAQVTLGFVNKPPYLSGSITESNGGHWTTLYFILGSECVYRSTR